MSIWIAIVPGIFAVLLLAGIGCAIKYGKAYWLINGYNAMSAEKKKNVNAEGLGRFMGNCLFALAGLIAAVTALFLLNLAVWALVALALLIPFIVYMVVRAQKFDGNAREKKGMSAQTKITVAMLVVVLGSAAVGVTLLIRSSMRPADYVVSGGTLEIKCSFGETVQIKDIQGLELAQARPDIATRTFGSAVGETLRGSFDLADGAAARVFTENATPPFIHFAVNGTQYYLNCSTPEETNKLYGELNSQP